MEVPHAWSIIIGISIPILVVVITKSWDPVAEYLGYPFDVQRRIKDLEDAAELLEEMKVDLLCLDPRPLFKQRVGWLERVEDLKREAREIKNGNRGSCSLNYFARCHFGREAIKALEKAKELAGQGEGLVQDARARPRPVHPNVDHEDRLWGMESYKEKVLKFVNDQDYGSRLLGIWGMGGVGKSSLLKLLVYSSTSNPIFDVILFVKAGWGCTVGQLQHAIAQNMGLPSVPNETSQEAIICSHLNDKSFLLLIDDLWGYLDLEAVGIPMPLGKVPDSHHQRKLVFTTRRLNVCGSMGCRNNTIRMKCLGGEDAWKLFESKAGEDLVNEHGIRRHAKEIVEECGGLPLALCMIGHLMSTKKYQWEWRSTIDLLKNSTLHEITDTHEDLFKLLKLGCDNMVVGKKNRFLLCSLWPENENISSEVLIRWWTGLGLLDVSNAKDTGYTIINGLVNASLLEKGDTGLHSTENSHVKMHKMIHKMALWIVNGHGEDGCKIKWLPKSSYRSTLAQNKWHTVEKAWVSQEDTSKWHHWDSKVRFRDLKMLVAQHAVSLSLIIRYFKNITFLDLEGMKIKQFPREMCELIELQHLNLSATTLASLPQLLQNLSKLKYLYIRNNMELQTIPEGLIFGLKNLRVLDLFCTSASHPKDQHPSSLLDELASPAIELPMLGFTVQKISDIKKLGQLERVCTQALCMYHFEEENHQATINLEFLFDLNELRELAIISSPHSLKDLVAEGGPNDDQWLLPYLEILELNNLLKLEKVTWKNAGMYIRVVTIYKCDNLKEVTWVRHLKLLEQLIIEDCQGMERLIETGASVQGASLNQTAPASFPRLKKLKLKQLPKLSMICKQACDFKELFIHVTQCNEMNDIEKHRYKNVKIDCGEDWWNRSSSGRLIPGLFPTFVS